MEYVFGSTISLAKQATDNVKLYRTNRKEQMKILETKVPEQIKITILNQSLNKGELKTVFDINRDFDFTKMLGLPSSQTFYLDQTEKEQLRKCIINYLTEQDFNFDSTYSKITVKWPDPNHNKDKEI